MKMVAPRGMKRKKCTGDEEEESRDEEEEMHGTRYVYVSYP